MNRLLLFCLVLLTTTSCVRPKIYRAEKMRRTNGEARELILNQELAARKSETAELTNRVAELSQTIGRQEKEIEQLKNQSSQQTQKMSESSGKLKADNDRLTSELAEKTTTLATRNALISKISAAQNKRQTILQTLHDSLVVACARSGFSNISTEIKEEKLILSLPDSLLFDKNGLTVASSGLPMLQIVGNFLAARPSLAVQIMAYTDNVFPKEKGLTIRDSWDWSLLRANVVGRVLLREFNVNDNQLSFVGRGEFYPIASNATAEGRAQNRRTELVFLPILEAVPMAK